MKTHKFNVGDLVYMNKIECTILIVAQKKTASNIFVYGVKDETGLKIRDYKDVLDEYYNIIGEHLVSKDDKLRFYDEHLFTDKENFVIVEINKMKQEIGL